MDDAGFFHVAGVGAGMLLLRGRDARESAPRLDAPASLPDVRTSSLRMPDHAERSRNCLAQETGVAARRNVRLLKPDWMMETESAS